MSFQVWKHRGITLGANDLIHLKLEEKKLLFFPLPDLDSTTAPEVLCGFLSCGGKGSSA